MMLLFKEKVWRNLHGRHVYTHKFTILGKSHKTISLNNNATWFKKTKSKKKFLKNIPVTLQPVILYWRKSKTADQIVFLNSVIRVRGARQMFEHSNIFLFCTFYEYMAVLLCNVSLSNGPVLFNKTSAVFLCVSVSLTLSRSLSLTVYSSQQNVW